MDKLNFFGVGPKIGRITLPFFAGTIALSIIFPGKFSFGEEASGILLIIGIILLALGLIFYFITLPALLNGLKSTKLMTTGSYAVCQNPLYAAIVLGIIPGIALMMNSWLVLLTTLVGYLVFRRCIKSEYEELEKAFGQEWQEYKKRTPEFFPFPFLLKK